MSASNTNTSLPLSVVGWIPPVLRDFRQHWRRLVLFQLVFKFLEAWMIAPVMALLLATLLARSGRLAATNHDLLDFFLSPTGLLAAAVFGSIAIVVLLFEQAGIMLLATNFPANSSGFSLRTLAVLLAMAFRIAKLGLTMLALLALALLPLLGLAVLSYLLLLTGHDIYYYLNVRPAAFWIALGIGSILATLAVLVVATLFVRWSLALPIAMLEGRFAPAALRESRHRIRGVWRSAALVLLGWQATILLLGAATLATFRTIAEVVVAYGGSLPIPRILLLLASQAVLLAAISFVRVVGQALLTLQLYRIRSPIENISAHQQPDFVPNDIPVRRSFIGLTCIALVTVIATPIVLWAISAFQLVNRPLVQITAHRGHKRAAPENTISAIQEAIVVGADYAELDVQHTADKVVVLLHDRDLRRVAGISRRLDQTTYAQLKDIDVGSWFNPRFSHERIPTLEEIIDLCRGRIRLNIELKVFSPNTDLPEDVARIVAKHHFEDECIITSLNYDTLLQAKRANPRIKTGLTIGHAIGNISRLDVDAFSVRADFLSDSLHRAIRRRGRQIHVWTIDDPNQMIRLMARGVDNIITGDPEMAIQTREQWQDRPFSEQLLLASRLLLGLRS